MYPGLYVMSRGRAAGMVMELSNIGDGACFPHAFRNLLLAWYFRARCHLHYLAAGTRVMTAISHISSFLISRCDSENGSQRK